MSRTPTLSRKAKHPPARRRGACIIAVVGGSGAGKSWLVEKLRAFFGRRACHVRLDDFYFDRSHLSPARRNHLNFDVPGAIDWARAEQVLRSCGAGRPTVMPHYDFVSFRVTARKGWKARPIIIVDGLWWLRQPRLRQLLDLKLYLDVPEALRRTRRTKRDIAERGFTLAGVEHQLNTRVLPLHARYVEPQKKWADLVLRQPYSAEVITQLAQKLWHITNRKAACTTPPPAFCARLTALLA